MRTNWWEMPDMVDWCNANGYHVAFNTIVKPTDCSLISWDADNLEHVYQKLSGRTFAATAGDRADVVSGNVRRYENLVENQIHAWWESQAKHERFFLKSYMG